MIIQKEIRGDDGKMRVWTIDYDDKMLIYSGYASDFKNKVMAIGKSEVTKVSQEKSAQDIINDIIREDI